MTPKTSPKRKYNSSRRQQQARQTRLQIAQAARRLFLKHGYAGATIEAIAEEAGVAKETVYAVFNHKRRILDFVLDTSIGGDDQPIRVMDRPETRAVLRDTSQQRQLAAFAGQMAQIMSRTAPIFELTRVAAKTEPEIASRIKRLYRERLGNMAIFVEHLAANGPLRGGLDQVHAAEIVWAVSSPDLYQLLVEYGGWENERYSQWLEDSLTRLLLP